MKSIEGTAYHTMKKINFKYLQELQKNGTPTRKLKVYSGGSLQIKKGTPLRQRSLDDKDADILSFSFNLRCELLPQFPPQAE